MVRIIPFDELATSDLIVDAVYEGQAKGNVSDDPISRLLPGVGNQGGFRAAGKRGEEYKVGLLWALFRRTILRFLKCVCRCKP